MDTAYLHGSKKSCPEKHKRHVQDGLINIARSGSIWFPLVIGQYSNIFSSYPLNAAFLESMMYIINTNVLRHHRPMLVSIYILGALRYCNRLTQNFENMSFKASRQKKISYLVSEPTAIEIGHLKEGYDISVIPLAGYKRAYNKLTKAVLPFCRHNHTASPLESDLHYYKFCKDEVCYEGLITVKGGCFYGFKVNALLPNIQISQIYEVCAQLKAERIKSFDTKLESFSHEHKTNPVFLYRKASLDFVAT